MLFTNTRNISTNKHRGEATMAKSQLDPKSFHPSPKYSASFAGHLTCRQDRVLRIAGSAWRGGGDVAGGGSEGGVAGGVSRSVCSSDVVCVEGGNEDGGAGSYSRSR